MFIKRKLKLNRFLLVIDTKKGVVISAVALIVSGAKPSRCSSSLAALIS